MRNGILPGLVMTIGLAIKVTVSMGAESRTVREGIVWDYDLHHRVEGENLDRNDNGYHFEGVEWIEGVEYHVFRNGAGEPQALMREEDRRVYLYTGRTHIKLSGDGQNEVLLYDFNLPAGATLRCGVTDFITADFVAEEEFEVLEVKEMAFGGPALHCQILREAYPEAIAIEGVGNTCGLLSLPQMVYTSCTGYNARSWEVVRVTDSNGAILFERDKADVLQFAGVTPDTESILYDLMGRRVERPVKGSVYVRQGRKVVF